MFMKRTFDEEMEFIFVYVISPANRIQRKKPCGKLLKTTLNQNKQTNKPYTSEPQIHTKNEQHQSHHLSCEMVVGKAANEQSLQTEIIKPRTTAISKDLQITWVLVIKPVTGFIASYSALMWRFWGRIVNYSYLPTDCEHDNTQWSSYTANILHGITVKIGCLIRSCNWSGSSYVG